MRRSVLRDSIVLVVLGTVAAANAGCGQSTAVKADHAVGSPVTRAEVVHPERAGVRRATEQPGQIEAYEVTPLHARVAGYVRKWNVDIGSEVRQGQVLAIVSVPELDAEAEQKQAQVEESEAKLAQAKAAEEVAVANLASSQAKLGEVSAGTKRSDADFARWQAEYTRVEQLSQSRTVTGSFLDETRSKLRASESARDEVHAQVKSVEAAIRQSQAWLDKARSDVKSAAASIRVARADARRVQALREFATIVAPYNGMVIQRNVDVGDLTEPGTRGQPLFTVARDDRVRIAVRVPELFATAVDAGDRVLIRLQALNDRTFEGKVSRTSWMLDAKSRTLRVEIDVPNPDRTLRPGLYAYATIIVDEHPHALTVPISALVREDSRSMVVIVDHGKAVRRPVQLGLTDANRSEIVSGLDGSEQVVKTYAAALRDGQSVEPIQPASPTPPKAKP